MDLKSTLHLQALKLRAASDQGASSPLLEALIEQHPEPLRQICARISPQLYEEVRNLCSLLDLPQRQFIELALIDAVNHANTALQETGAMDALTSKE